MELKDAILSTLAEIDTQITNAQSSKKNDVIETANEIEQKIEKLKKQEKKDEVKEVLATPSSSDETQFLEELKERMLVLFEGFQSPNNNQIEAKIDLTLNFLEYLLAVIDERINKINNKENQ